MEVNVKTYNVTEHILATISICAYRHSPGVELEVGGGAQPGNRFRVRVVCAGEAKLRGREKVDSPPVARGQRDQKAIGRHPLRCTGCPGWKIVGKINDSHFSNSGLIEAKNLSGKTDGLFTFIWTIIASYDLYGFWTPKHTKLLFHTCLRSQMCKTNGFLFWDKTETF